MVCHDGVIPKEEMVTVENLNLKPAPITAGKYIEILSTQLDERDTKLREIYRLANNACHEQLSSQYEKAMHEICDLIRPIPCGSDEYHGDRFISPETNFKIIGPRLVIENETRGEADAQTD
jgi:hypothetical protein